MTPDYGAPGERAPYGRALGWLLAMAALVVLSFGLGRCSPRAPASEAEAPRGGPSPGESRGIALESVAPAPPPPPPPRGEGFVAEYVKTGGVRLVYRHAPVGKTDYHFWGPPWNYAPRTLREVDAGPAQSHFRVEVPDLGLHIDTEVASYGDRELRYRYDIAVSKPLRGIVGGGLEFLLDRKTTEALGQSARPPELLPENRGFSWLLGENQRLRVEFDPPLPKVYFEQGNPFQIRCFFIGENAEPGSRRYTMRIEVPAKGSVVANADRRYGGTSTRGWHTGTLTWDQAPLDLSYLNASDRPAGSRGRIRVSGDRLVYPDGTGARFWGTNLQAYAIFATDRALIAAQAKRLAAFGYNLVRLHHHDSHWVHPNVFESEVNHTQALREESLDAIDYWVKCLTEAGIYVWLDLHVGRVFRPGDAVPGLEELGESAQGMSYVNPRIESLMDGFARRYLDRKNRYTGRRYTEDPGILAVLITNENDLTTHFGLRLSREFGSPKHEVWFREALGAFTRRIGSAPIEPREVWRPGVAKIALADLEARFFGRAIERLRGFGTQALIATTNYWGNEPFFSLPALALGDVIDAHSYGEEDYLSTNPRLAPHYLHWVAAAQLADKPLTISEWALEMTRRDRHTAPLYMAALASFQGWDAPIHFTYQQDPFRVPERARLGNNAYDPGVMAMMPAAALLFREGHVKPARNTYALMLSRKSLYEEENSPETSVALRTLSEQSRVVVALPDLEVLDWDDFGPAPTGAKPVTDLDRDFLAPEQKEVVSDTGELRRNWAVGYHVVNSERTQGAAGFLGGQTLELQDVTLRIGTPNAAVALTSLDGKPISSSRRLLLSTVAQVRPNEEETLPFRSEPISGELLLKRTGRWRIVPLAADGRGLGQEELVSGSQGVQVRLTGRHPTHWFLLTDVNRAGRD